jgi:hypothetical protein
VDFSKLGRVSRTAKSIDPIELFEKLPSLPDTPNDLWRGQTEALAGWHKNRTANDVLVGLNTGAGKTLVGLLIAQSLVNEGVENVVHVCATIDLVRQTAREAKRIGLEVTTRTGRRFDNDLFESGRAFCITTYQAVFSGLSAIRRSFPPGALIFDDAHVAEGILRDAFLLRISFKEDQKLFQSLMELFEPEFQQLERRQQFRDACSGQRPLLMMVPPGGVRSRQNRLAELLVAHGANEKEIYKYSFAHFADRITSCAVFFGKGVCEITPPFLPSLAMDVFDRPIRLVGGVTPSLVSTISRKRKAVIAVPTYNGAAAWDSLARPPDKAEFSDKLNSFREAKSGTFVLVSRVDGIDLPHDTCRVMIMDGLPSGASLRGRPGKRWMPGPGPGMTGAR